MILRVEESRLELNRAREMRERGVGLAQLSAHVAETIVCGGKIRQSFDGTFVGVSGAGEIFRSLFRLAEEEEGLR